jgi:hypothetical protein
MRMLALVVLLLVGRRHDIDRLLGCGHSRLPQFIAFGK